MKLNKLLLLVVLFLTSCSVITSENKNYFDKEMYDAQLNSWEALDIQNYSFTYKKRGSCPCLDIIGNVTVKDGVGTVIYSIPESIIDTEDYTPSEEDDALLSITKVYENIYSAYQNDISDDFYLYSEYSITYDEEYPVPIQVDVVNVYKEEVDGLISYNLTISDLILSKPL